MGEDASDEAKRPAQPHVPPAASVAKRPPQKAPRSGSFVACVVVALAAFFLLAAMLRAANRLHINVPGKPSTVSQQAVEAGQAARLAALSDAQALAPISGPDPRCHDNPVRVDGDIPFGLKT